MRMRPHRTLSHLDRQRKVSHHYTCSYRARNGLVDDASHAKVHLGDVVVRAVAKVVDAADRLGQQHRDTGPSGEDLWPFMW